MTENPIAPISKEEVDRTIATLTALSDEHRTAWMAGNRSETQRICQEIDRLYEEQRTAFCRALLRMDKGSNVAIFLKERLVQRIMNLFNGTHD